MVEPSLPDALEHFPVSSTSITPYTHSHRSTSVAIDDRCQDTGSVPFRIRTRNLLPRSEQHRLVPQLSLLRSVDRFEHELAVVHLLGRFGMEGDSVHDWFEILREELSEESDFVEMRRHGGMGVEGEANAIEGDRTGLNIQREVD